MNSIKHLLSKYGILAGCLIFVFAIKFPHLNLPYSWDEAWSYLPAVLKMYENGPSILPSSIEILDSKGHPLLFYFLVTSWMKIFSPDIQSVRIFLLLVSMLLVISVFVIAQKLTNKTVANASVVLFSVQSLFLAQASLLLPEVLLTLFFLITFYFFLSNRWVLYSLSATLMVLTKETGLVFAFGFGVYYLLDNGKFLFSKKSWKPLIFLTIPAIVYGVHLTLTFLSFQTFFFNEHLDYISVDSSKILRVIKSATGILFTRYGRNVISFLAVVSLSSLLFRKHKITQVRILWLSIFQIVLLLLFSSVNFYTYRYILPVFPLFILFSVILFYNSFGKTNYLFYPILILMICSPLWYSLTKKGKTDNDLGYATYLPIHQSMVRFCEAQNWEGKKFAADFNMAIALRDPFTGYHTSKTGFKTQHLPDIQNAEIIILDSTGDIKQIPENQKEEFVLKKRFENKNHWGEIYLRRNPDNK